MNRNNKMDKQCIVFGAGMFGKKYFDAYQNQIEIIAFCDNSPEKQQKGYLELPVISLNELISYKNIDIVVACKNHLEVALQLLAVNIKRFVLYSQETIFKPVKIDLSKYHSFEIVSRKIALLEMPTGGSCYALKKYCGPVDLDLCLIDPLDSGEKYFDLLTSEMIVTQNADYVPRGKKHIEIWHGFTIKCIFSMSKTPQIKGYTGVAGKNLEYADKILSYSQLYTIFMGHSLSGVEPQRFEVTGMPRCDMLFRSDGKKHIAGLFPEVQHNRVIVYAPTFREIEQASYHDEGDGIIFSWEDYDADKLEAFMAEKKALLLIKAHFRELARFNVRPSEHVRIIDNDFLKNNGLHMYELLSGADLLVSDYSSIWVDYLLLDRPLVFAVRDLEKYEREYGLMTLPFEEWAPGDIIMDFAGLLAAVSQNLENPETHSDFRKRMARIYHKHLDGNSSERVLSLIRDIIGNETEVR